MFTSPRCRVCFDKVCIFADIVLGDPWRMTEVDEEHGDSLIVSKTDKGEELLREMQKAGVINMTPRDTNELISGQLVPQRKRQVALYSKALLSLPTKANSYLYKQEENVEIDQNELKKAEEEYRIFMANERKSKEQITSIARKIILKHLAKLRLKCSIAYKAMRKVYRLVKRIFKR